MQESNRKREIEAICDTWEGGLLRYLVGKIKQFVEIERDEMDWIGINDLGDEVVDVVDLINEMNEI